MHDQVQAYTVEREFVNDLNSLEDQRSDAFAKNLCVVEGDVPLESSTLNEDQAGLLLDLDGKEVLFPAIKECILSVDMENRQMKVHVMDGLLDL